MRHHGWKRSKVRGSSSSSSSSRIVDRRQEMADATQQLRTEMNETINGRIDMLSIINTALQNVSAKLCWHQKPHRISDLTRCERSNDKG